MLSLLEHFSRRYESEENATIHVSHKIENIVRKLNMALITINPYSPSLNPCEGVIGSLKSKLRNDMMSGR